jgi:hypothetical protein
MINSQYREEAKIILSGRHFSIFLIGIVVNLPASVPSFLNEIAFGNSSLRPIQILERYPLWYVFLFIYTLLVSPIVAYMTQKLYIEVADGGDPKISFLFGDTFSEGPLRSIVFNLLSGLIITLWSFLLIIPGIIASYSYSMGYYLLNAEYGLEPIEAMKKSKQMMYGNRFDLFVLDFSYIGWYILGALTLGIALIWGVPRHQTARTLFLHDVYGKFRRRSQSNSSWMNNGSEHTNQAIEEAKLQ